MTTSHLITHRELTLNSDIHLDHFNDARGQIITFFQAIDPVLITFLNFLNLLVITLEDEFNLTLEAFAVCVVNTLDRRE